MNTPRPKDLRVANNLKRIRGERDLSVDFVIALLENRGFYISGKTLYAYETGYSTPNADIFLALCDIYQVSNILKEFEYGDEIMPDISSSVLLSIPPIRAVYEFGENRNIDITPVLQFITNEKNSGILSSLVAGRGLRDPLKRIIEETCGYSIEEIYSILKISSDADFIFSLSPSESAAVRAFVASMRQHADDASAEPEAPAEEAELAHQILQDKRAEDASPVSSGAAGEKKEA